jgi:hypothetical protein
MIYVKLRSISLAATVTNKRSNTATRSVGDLFKKYETGKFSRLEFVPQVSYR